MRSHKCVNKSLRGLRTEEFPNLENFIQSMESFATDLTNFIAEYDIEIEREEPARELLTGRSSPTSSEDVAPHADDPLADEEWTAKYDKEREADEELERKLKDRFNGKVEVREWCVR